MLHRIPIYLLLCAVLAACPAVAQDEATRMMPGPMREFRAAWVATVANIDWPSKPGLPADAQKAELLAILDKAVDINLNAIIFQVRPAADALYDSKLEPWSDFLTGTMGKPPEPYYDPLEFAVKEAHKRGLELHAWFNPYRAHHPGSRSEISENHLSKKRPDIVKKYGTYLWMDPGEPDVQKHSLDVVMDVVKRYDVDGIHIDDYFYPYKVSEGGKTVDFPDEPSWKRYTESGGTMERDDWRRENVNTFILKVYQAIKGEKPWVKFGISPFGIWRPGYPPQIKGFDQYSQLYADARKWLMLGWIDYWTPQLYWRIAQTDQSYPVLLKWWVSQNEYNRHIWPGNFTSKIGDPEGSAWPASEVVDQIMATRAQAGANGNVHFSMKVFLRNRDGINDKLKAGPYAEKALVPASTWLDDTPPPAPEVKIERSAVDNTLEASWSAAGEDPWLWVAYIKDGGQWKWQILPADQRSLDLTGADPATAPSQFALTAVDRCGNESAREIIDLKRS